MAGIYAAELVSMLSNLVAKFPYLNKSLKAVAERAVISARAGVRT